MGKASRRKDIVDVIKEQTRKEKRDAGMRRSNATGISAAALSMIAPAHTMGEGSGHRAVGGGDLNMHTYDILDVDRLKFSTLAGSQDRLIATDHGIESASHFIDDQENILSFGMNFQIPGSDSMGATGMAYYFKIGTSAAQVKIIQNSYSGINLTLKSADSGDKPAALTFSGASTEAKVDVLSIFSDGTDIKAKNSSGTVYTLTSSGGVSLSDDNTWTGANIFTAYVQMNQSSAANQSWGVEAGGYFNVKDSGGTIRKVPYLI